MRINHAAIFVSDIERAVSFFERYFGAAAGAIYHNPKTGFSSRFVSFDSSVMLEIMNNPSTSDAVRASGDIGYAHIAMSVGSEAAVDELTARLARDGYEVIGEPRITGDGYYESCILDAEGNRIEITE